MTSRRLAFVMLALAHCGCCSRLARRPSKPHDTELDTLLGPDGTSGGASGGAAGAGVDAHATAVRQLLPAFWRHFWPFLKASWRGRALAGATLLMCLLSAGLSSEFCRHAAPSTRTSTDARPHAYVHTRGHAARSFSCTSNTS